MAPCLAEVYGNASSIHHFGQMAKQRLEMARRQTAALLHCRPQEIVFVSGGTEADNLAMLGVAAAVPGQARDHHRDRASGGAGRLRADRARRRRSDLSAGGLATELSIRTMSAARCGPERC